MMPEQMQAIKDRCKCDICLESNRFFTIIYGLNDIDRKWMENFYSQIDNERMDADVNAAILDGSWPTADQYLLEGLKQFKEKHGNEER